jgi:hypothetical protein
MTMTQEEKSNHPGQIIWKQLSMHTKMACGAREAKLCTTRSSVGFDGIIFKVGSLPMRYVEVELDASDTYVVRALRFKRSTYEKITLEEHTGVYADMLNEVVYRAVNK